MKKKKRIEDYVESITGKVMTLQNGDVIVSRRGKSGKVHRYQMHFEKGNRTVNQIEHTTRFKKARAEADRILKVKSCRMKWEVSFRACEGVLKGKKYCTLRGFVVASCYQREETSESCDDG